MGGKRKAKAEDDDESASGSAKVKRERDSNFSDGELQELLQFALASSVLERPETDNATNKMKEREWQECATKLSAVHGNVINVFFFSCYVYLPFVLICFRFIPIAVSYLVKLSFKISKCEGPTAQKGRN